MGLRVAIIGDVGGLVGQLSACLAEVGVVGDRWPAGLHVVQVGDLFGGFDDVAVAELVEAHLLAGRWTQLVGNWELGAVGGFSIGRRGRTAHPDALERFAAWCDGGLVRYAVGVRARSGSSPCPPTAHI